MEPKEKDTKKKKSVFTVVGKVFLWIIASVLFLIMLVLILIQTSFVQNFARKKVVAYLENKLHTKVEIGKLDVKFPTALSLQNVFLEDQSKDTLLYGGEVKVDIDMVKLISSDIEIKEIALNNIVLKVKRLPPDSVFNFQFIVDAFNTPSKKPANPKDTSSLKMNIDRILVNKTRIVYKDAFTGNDMDLTFGHFDTKINTFDPSHLLFDIPSITLNGLSGHFYQVAPLKQPIQQTVATEAAKPEKYLQLLNKEINISNVNVAYKSEPSHINSAFVIGNAVVHPKTIDLKNSIVTLKDASLSDANITMQTDSKASAAKPKDTAKAVSSSPSMKIIAGDISVKNVNLNYDDISAPKAPSGMDFSHLAIQDFSTDIANLNYSTDTILASVRSTSMKEKSGFVLNDFKTDFSMIPTGVSLKNLLIRTPNCEIQRDAVISYPSLDAVKKNPGVLGLNIDLAQTKINVGDIWLLMPSLKKQMASLPATANLYVDAQITGKVSDLTLKRVRLRGLTTTDIDVSGTIKGLPDSKKLNTDLTINKFQTSKSDLLAFIPAKSLPQSISLPNALSVSGTVKGGMNNLYANLTLNSTDGGVKFNGSLINITDKKKAVYDIALKARNLQLGKLMKNPKLGSLTADIKAKGKGYDPKTANATFNGIISNATFNKYNYRNITISGNMAGQNYKINLNAKDPNLAADLKASGNFSGKYPTLVLNGTIDSIRAKQLHFTTNTLIYHGAINAGFSSLDPDHLNGNLTVLHSILVTDSERIQIDSLALIAKDAPGNQSLDVITPFVSLGIHGQYTLTQLGNVFQQAINPYFALSTKKDTAKVNPYHFNITGSVVNSPVLRSFVPKLTQLKPILLAGNFSSDSGWNVSLTSPHIVYGTMLIDSANFIAATQNGSLAFNTSFRHFISGTSFKIFATRLSGTLKNNDLDFTLNIKDQESKDKYNLRGNLDQPSLNKYVFSLKPDSLLLNYNKWTANAGNRIQYFNKDINARNFVLSQGDQELSINSIDSGKNEPLQLMFTNFRIATLTGFVQSDSLLVDGLLNGKAMVKDIQTNPKFTTDLSVNQLSIYKDTIGDLTVKVNNNVASTYHGDVTLEGKGNDVKINGDYKVDSANSSFNFVLDIVSLQMKSLEGFTKGGIKDARGNLYGKVALNGTVKNPNIDGTIQFNETSFNVTKLNNVFKIDKEAIAIINNKGIEFNKFSIRDTANNTITLDGAINTTDFYNYTFDMVIRARNFQALNSTNKDNQLFYGKFVFSTNLTVKGTPSHPIIDGTFNVEDKTDFTAVLPQNTPSVQSRQGIVRFVDKRASEDDSLFMAPYDSLKKTSFQGYDVTLNIKIDKNAIFNLIVDAGNGDFLRLKGDGELTAGVDASGKITLAGSYQIDEGAYNLSFNFLKRKFDIQKGSKITWTGEPTSAQIDITGIYIANTAPIDLVQDQLVNVNQTIYKQKLPFEVHLLLQGELLKPLITFDIVLPTDKNYTVSEDVVNTVQTKLAQIRQEPSEINKQVFALLLLGRFVGENPFQSSGGSMDAGTLAMQSVSRLLSEQLNQLASNLVQGVDINFDLATTQDYSTGTEQNKTDLNVGVSKRLLSDRLTVSVGSDFQLQGPMQTNQGQNSLAGNIAVTYKLSKDGKYLLRAYRKNDYTGEIEGYVIETGVSFIISVQFNKFRQIFITKKEREEKRHIKKSNKEINKADEEKEEKQKTIVTPSKAKEND